MTGKVITHETFSFRWNIGGLSSSLKVEMKDKAGLYSLDLKAL
jgi:hypothetical protein